MEWKVRRFEPGYRRGVEASLDNNRDYFFVCFFGCTNSCPLQPSPHAEKFELHDWRHVRLSHPVHGLQRLETSQHLHGRDIYV